MGDAQRRHTKTVSGKCGLASVVGPDLLIFCRQHFVHPSDVTVAACGHIPRRGRLSHHHRCLGGWESRQGLRRSVGRARSRVFRARNDVFERSSCASRERSGSSTAPDRQKNSLKASGSIIYYQNARSHVFFRELIEST